MVNILVMDIVVMKLKFGIKINVYNKQSKIASNLSVKIFVKKINVKMGINTMKENVVYQEVIGMVVYVSKYK